MTDNWPFIPTGGLLERLLWGRDIRARLIRGTGGTFALRVANMGFKFLASYMLARLLGVDGYGVYNFAVAWIMLLIVPAISGFDRLLVRNLALYRSQSAWGYMHGLLRFVNRFTLVFSILLMVVGIGIAWLTYHFTGRPALLNAEQGDLAEMALYTLAFGLVLLPLRAILLLQQAALQGLRHVVVGQLPEQVFQPALFVVLVGGLYLAGAAIDSAQIAIVLHVLTAAAAVVFSVYLMRRLVPSVVQNAAAVLDVRLWFLSALPFAASRGLSTLDAEIDALMLGTLDSAESVALFTITLRGTQLIILVLLSVHIALGPTIVQLYAEKNFRDLQRVTTQGARMAVVGALPITIAFIILGKPFLGIFGEEYRVAHTALIILSMGQLVNALTGIVGVLLLLTDYQREVVVVSALGIGLHLVLNFLLIPRWGIEGAAVAGAIVVAAKNIIYMGIVWYYMRLHTTPLGVIRLRGRR